MRFSKFGIFGLMAAFMFITACASTPNPLSLEVRDQYFLKTTNIGWDLSEKEQKAEDKKDAGDEEGKRAEGRDELTEKLALAVNKEFESSPSGPTPMVFDISITRYDRVGAFVGNMIGGSDLLKADVTVKNADTGEVLGVYEDVKGERSSNKGFLGAVVQSASKPDIPGLMSRSFAKRLRKKFEKKKVKSSSDKS